MKADTEATVRRLARSCFLLGSALVGSLAWGHHSGAIYDMTSVRTITGLVTKYEWRNPHVYVYVQAADSSLEPAVWEIEASATAAMRRYGWSQDSLAPGDRVTVRYNPVRTAGKHAGFGVTMTMRDGKVVQVNGPPPAEEKPPVYAATSLSGIWLPSGADVPRFLSLEQSPDGWPLTEKGRAFVQKFTVAVDEAAMNCTPYAAPYAMLWPLPTKIAVGDDTVSIRFSVTGDEERIVHLDAKSHDDAPYTPLGHSIGAFRGETLVVDSARFANHPEGNAARLASGSRKHVTETFELADDRTRLTYHYVLEDPEYLKEPVQGSEVWTYRPDLEYAPPPCDVANARRYLQ